MKKSIIKDIFYRERGQNDTIKESEEYWSKIKEAAKISNTLIESLNDKQKEIFKELEFAEMGIESATALTFFTEGFKVGLLIGLECLES